MCFEAFRYIQQRNSSMHSTIVGEQQSSVGNLQSAPHHSSFFISNCRLFTVLDYTNNSEGRKSRTELPPPPPPPTSMPSHPSHPAHPPHTGPYLPVSRPTPPPGRRADLPPGLGSAPYPGAPAGTYPAPPPPPAPASPTCTADELDAQDTTVELTELTSLDEDDSYTTSLERLNQLRGKRIGADNFNMLSY